MIFRPGDRVRVVSNPYGDMLRVQNGDEGIITQSGDKIVGLKLDSGLSCKCWLVTDGNGQITLEHVDLAW